MHARCILATLLVTFDSLRPSQGQPTNQDGQQASWLDHLFGQATWKRTDKDDSFWAARGKREAPGHDPEFWALRGKRQYIKPNGFFQAFPSLGSGTKRTKDYRGGQGKRSIKPNGLFGAFKRAYK